MNRYSRWLAASLWLLALSITSPAESIGQDTSQIKKNFSRHSPRKATIYSAILPGLGQAYNRKYWKMPLIYAGFGTLGYFIHFNHGKYTLYRDEYIYRRDNNSTVQSADLAIFSEDDLLLLKNYYRRNLEYSIVFTALLYVLNMIDANVDAHLLQFDISDDLSLRVQPCLLQTSHKALIQGMQLYLSF